MGDEMNLIAKLPFFIGRRPSIWSHASEQPPLGERGPVQGTVADDDVVVERDVEQPRAVGKLAREPDVLPTRSGIAAYAELSIAGVMRTTGLCGVVPVPLMN